MKLLIVDDEELTRNGLISIIKDWTHLNIDEIFQADDGIHALDIAKKEAPEIILSDVRMPRMTGIEMAKEIAKILPDSCIIFMSGYSDIEYLKEAITLKAIRYVEKPINLTEIEDALTNAIASYSSKKQSLQLKTRNDGEKLALSFTHPSGHPDILPEAQITSIISTLNLPINDTTYFTTIILQLFSSVTDISAEKKALFYETLQKNLAQLNFQEIHATKYDSYIVFHIYGSKKPDSIQLQQIGTLIKQALNEDIPYFISIGSTACGYEQVYQSYSSAVLLLQKSFFTEYQSILTESDESQPVNTPVYTDPSDTFEAILSVQDETEYFKTADHIYHMFRHNQMLLPAQIKDIYYRLFMSIRQFYKTKELNHLPGFQELEKVLSKIHACHTLLELHQMLTEQLTLLLSAHEEEISTNPIIANIQNFVKQNYNNESLSVKDISEAVFLSSSYVCTLFKTETGMTLNQYITETRIEKAKQLLTDPSYKINDVALRTGYADSNYFTKIFKKHTGLSPKEYREKKL